MNTMNVVVLIVIMLTLGFGDAGRVDTIDLRKLVRISYFFV